MTLREVGVNYAGIVLAGMFSLWMVGRVFVGEFIGEIWGLV